MAAASVGALPEHDVTNNVPSEDVAVVVSQDDISPLIRTPNALSSSSENVVIAANAEGISILDLKQVHKSRCAFGTKHDFKEAATPATSFGLPGRSKTLPLSSIVKQRRSLDKLDGLKRAKQLADRAMHTKKVFTIQGPYAAIRNSLRRRGWVEKFYRMAPLPHRSPRKKKKPVVSGEVVGPTNSDDSDSDGDDDDDLTDDDDLPGRTPPWEEDGGLYGIMSRMVRNQPPSFIWSVRRDAIDLRSLRRDQIVNHYGRAGTFTTKVGLCMSMRMLQWFDEVNPDALFPRCFRLSHDEDKAAFIDEYRLTSCLGVLKIIVDADGYPGDPPAASDVTEEQGESPAAADGAMSSPKIPAPKKRKRAEEVPVTLVQRSLEQVQRFLRTRTHDDIDDAEGAEPTLSDGEWDQLITWFYLLAHERACVAGGAAAHVEMARRLLQEAALHLPQLDMDGTKNVWIVKPGAKSRGRGIQCFNRLEDMLKLVSASVVKKESKWVVQKYIERPLLIYGTKFDIRQWFLVTDWNPLTIWFYRDSYLRFCSQIYTLERFDEAIHLCNNAVQAHYVNQTGRSNKLPLDNMWSSDEFRAYLREKGQDDAWEERIYPGMKNAIRGALLCTQDFIEYRKSAFELYGADFMLTEDLRPWLIEINCSPSMSYSTPVTARLCEQVPPEKLLSHRSDAAILQVLEDTIKVVLDKKHDRNADTGAFECIYRQAPVTVPPYIGINLAVEGNQVRKPGWLLQQQRQMAASQSQGSKYATIGSKVDSLWRTSQKPSSSETQEKDSGKKGNFTQLLRRAEDFLKAHNTNNNDNHHVKLSSSHSATDLSDKENKPMATKSSSSTNHRERKVPNITKSNSTTNCDSSKVTVTFTEKLKDGGGGGGGRRGKRRGARESTSKTSIVTSESSDTAAAPDMTSSQSEPRLTRRVRRSHTLAVTSQDRPRAPAAPPTAVGLKRSAEFRLALRSPSLLITEERRSATCIPDPAPAAPPGVSSVETVDLSTLPGACADGAWSRACARCGAGGNIKLDSSAEQEPCSCQRDSLRVIYTDNVGGVRRAGGVRTPDILPHPYTQYRRSPVAAAAHLAAPPLQRSHSPLASGATRMLSNVIPRRLRVDESKLVSSVYAKAQASNVVQPRYDGRFVLRYTDAAIQKPPTPPRAVPTNSFPRLVSKYISKARGAMAAKDGVPVSFSEYYRTQASVKMSIVTQSFV